MTAYDALRSFEGDFVEGAVMRTNLRARLFGERLADRPQVGPFELRRQLGRGGMGIVFAGYDPRLRRDVAIKLIPTGDRSDASSLLDEAQALAAITHPNVVQVFSVGRVCMSGRDAGPASAHDRLYIAMELVHGLTLRRWRIETEPTALAIVEAYAQAARGLAAAHRCGITHGDFKPDNAMIDQQGRVRAMDFGLALRQGQTTNSRDSTDLEHTPAPRRALAGTPGYIAPELIAGEAPGPRSDQWALCASLHEAIVGEPPPRGKAPRSGSLRSARGVPRPVIAALLRGLDPDPARRFPTMDALAEQLARKRLGGSAALVGTMLVLAIGTSSMMMVPPDPSCRVDPRLAATWNEEHRAAVRSVFLATPIEGVPAQADPVVAALDDYADAWAAAYRTVCESGQSHDPSPPAERDATRACVERGRSALATLRDGLLEGDANALVMARDAIERLPSLDGCFSAETTRWPRPSDPTLAREVERVHEELAVVASAASLGQRGTEPFLALRERAKALGHPPLSAEIEARLGAHETVAGDPAVAAAGLEQAYLIAIAHGMHALASRAATDLAMLEILAHTDAAAAQRWLRAAEATGRAEDVDTLEPERIEVQVEIEIASNHLDRAMMLAKAELEAAERRCPKGCSATIIALRDLGHVERYRGRTHEANAWAERGHTEAVERLGPLHPLTLELSNLVGTTLTDLGHADQAVEVLERLLAQRSSISTTDSLILVATEYALAQALLAAHRQPEAEAGLERVLEAAEHLHHEHFVGMATAELSRIYFGRGDLQGALTADRRAIAAMESVYGEEHPTLSTMHNNHAKHLEAAGKPHEALAAALRGWTMWKQASPEPSPQDAAFLLNIGALQRSLGRTEEGTAALEQAVEATRAHEDTTLGIRARAALTAAREPARPASAH